MIISPAKRTEQIQEYYFSRKLKEIDALNEKRLSEQRPRIINLGIGAPDRMPPQEAIEELISCAQKADSHKYQSYVGCKELREAFAVWYQRYYGVSLDPKCEIQPLFGSKEGILLISLAFLNEGDKVLVPDPGYPTYSSASKLVGAQILNYDLKEEEDWHPDFEALERMDLEGVKIMWTNYPNMPTGGRATKDLYQKLVDFALRHNILIVNDNPYSFILNDEPLSIFGAEGAKACALELNSLSKAHNMSGWRVGMIAGAKEYIAEVLKVKSQMDSGMFKPMQLAAVKALQQGPQWYAELNAEYARRREVAFRIMSAIGLEFNRDSAGLFVWGRIPDDCLMLADADGMRGGVSLDVSRGERLSDDILYASGVFLTPGFIFGKNGENYLRISLCADVETLCRAESAVKEWVSQVGKVLR